MAEFKDIQQNYWKQVIINYVESLGDDNERAQAFATLENDGLTKIVDQLMNDDEMWSHIDECISYYVNKAK